MFMETFGLLLEVVSPLAEHNTLIANWLASLSLDPYDTLRHPHSVPVPSSPARWKAAVVRTVLH
jgi:hypothetical protein